MAKFEVVAVTLALFAIAYAGQEEDDDSQEDVSGSDDCNQPSKNYTDLPRIFDHKDPCPAKNFYVDCNECTCTKVGDLSPACGSMVCPKIPQIANWGEKGVLCPAGKQFYWKCTKCDCDKTGSEAVCTEKAPDNKLTKPDSQLMNPLYNAFKTFLPSL